VGGRGRRIGGRDKSLLDVGGRAILDRQVDALAGVVDRIILVDSELGPARHPRLETFADRWPGGGSLGGIWTALSVAGDGVLALACDMPFVTPAFLAFLRDAVQGVDAAVPRTADGWHPLCACYAASCLEPMRRRLAAGQYKVIDALKGLRIRDIGEADLGRFDPEGLLLTNVNTPEDLSRAAARAGRGSATA
jgi:molybdopterin-guanine dinucleotide biosynthesis protein A